MPRTRTTAPAVADLRNKRPTIAGAHALFEQSSQHGTLELLGDAVHQHHVMDVAADAVGVAQTAGRAEAGARVRAEPALVDAVRAQVDTAEAERGEAVVQHQR